jgi:quinol monooxygenase YgiN
MTTISTENNPWTVMIRFTVEPQHQQALIDTIVEFVSSYVRHQRGFVSANLHRSLDGTRVINYAQWRSREDYEAFSSNPATAVNKVIEFVRSGKAQNESHAYEVAFIAEQQDSSLQIKATSKGTP